jgi:hypothetical protein
VDSCPYLLSEPYVKGGASSWTIPEKLMGKIAKQLIVLSIANQWIPNQLNSIQ